MVITYDSWNTKWKQQRTLLDSAMHNELHFSERKKFMAIVWLLYVLGCTSTCLKIVHYITVYFPLGVRGYRVSLEITLQVERNKYIEINE